MIYFLENQGGANVDYDDEAIVGNDQGGVLVDCSFDEAGRLAREWNLKAPLLARAGKHCSESGDVVFVDGFGEHVESASDVVKTLDNLDRLMCDIGVQPADVDDDDKLHMIGRVF